MLRSCSRRLPARLRPLGGPKVTSNIRPLFRTRTLATVAPPPRAREPTELDHVTTLPNGLRVATEEMPHAFSGVGVYIDAGSRYENDYLRGSSHILDRLAFKSTHSHTADEMSEQVEMLGGNIHCASSREAMMYQAATFNNALPTAVGMLAETIRDPLITEDEVQQQLFTAEYEVNEIWSRPELILPELVHAAAFKDNTLGNPLLCPKERIPVLNKDVIDAYRNQFYRPERMVLAFAGVSAENAVKLAEQHFGDMKGADIPDVVSETASQTSSTSSSDSDSAYDSDSSTTSSLSSMSSSSSSPQQQQQSSPGFLSNLPWFKKLSTSASRNASPLSNPSMILTPDQLNQPAKYTGGFLSLPPRPPSPIPTQPAFTHIYLAFEGVSISDDDIYALATLHTLLGGGGSFSAGGPGKGMYSRLYTNVLNQYGWVDSCIAFNHSFTDSGLFGIAASCYPGRTARMLEIMCAQLHALTLDHGFSALGAQEVQRAKNQLRSSLLMNLESRMLELEDLGRQIQVHGRRVPVHEMTRKVNNLTVKDLRRVAKKVLGGLAQNKGQGSGAPTVVLWDAIAPGMSEARSIGWDQIQDIIHQSKLGRGGA